MNLRPKTKRRLAFLLLCLLLSSAILSAMLHSLHLRNIRRHQAFRQTGLAAYHAGDYETALQSLSTYLSKAESQTDAEALLAYGQSRRRIQKPNLGHVIEAIQIFKRYLELRPADQDARHALLEEYTQANFNTEALALADTLLAQSPSDPAALENKTLALIKLRRFEQALQASEQWNQAAPFDLDGQATTYYILAALNRPAADLLGRAEKMRQDHPGDARFELLQTYAFLYASRQDPHTPQPMLDNALRVLRSAANATPPDAAFVRQLARLFDSQNLFTETEQVLKRVAASASDPKVLALLAQRLWQNGRYEELADRLKNLDPASCKADPSLPALRAAALLQLNRANEAAPILENLSRQTDDETAQAWAIALNARFGSGPRDTLSTIARYQSALTRDPNNPILHFWMGETYLRLGENQSALQAWHAAGNLAPSWAAPRLLIARTLASSGQTRQAIAEAQAAYTRRNTLSSAVALALAMHTNLGKDTGPEAEKTLDLLRQIQHQSPNENETLPLYIDLLSRLGQRRQALARLDQILHSPNLPPQQTLLRLAAASRAHHLGLDQSLLALARKTYGLTPQLAFTQALDLLADNKPRDGLRHLLEAGKAATDNPAQWQLILARYRETIQDPSAADAWTALGDTHPADLSVQQAILASHLAWNNRALIARTIDRLHELTGDDALAWRLARAKWLLRTDDAQDKQRNTTDAVFLLSDIVRSAPDLAEPRQLLALAYEMLGNTPGAIEQLKTVVRIDPSSHTAMLTLARLLQTDGKFIEARDCLDRLASLPAPGATLCRAVASLYAAQGLPDRALTILEKLPPAAQDLPTRLTIAQLHRKLGHTRQADLAFQQLLADPSADAPALCAAADFAAAQSQPARARELLSRLSHLRLPPGTAHALRGEFYERHGDLAAAQNAFIAAVQTDPANTGLWRQYAGFELRRGDTPHAAAAIEQGLKTAPNDPGLLALKFQSDALLASSRQPDLQPLIETLAGEHDVSPGLLETLTLLSESGKSNESAEDFLIKLRRTAARHPRFLPLQLLLVRGCLAAGQVDEAAQLAMQLIEAFPDAVEPARTAAALFASLDRGSEMLFAAQKWRQRTLDQPLQADAAIAEACLLLAQPRSAVAQLQPYLPRATARPDENAPVLGTYARALVLLNRQSEAAALLQPHLAGSPRLRRAWLAIASRDLDLPLALTWLRQVTPLIPADSYAEHLQLAQAWHTLGQRCNYRDGFAAARVCLTVFARRSDATEAQILIATSSEALGDLRAAESAYRNALKIRPDFPVVRNNLAMVLLNSGDARRLPEALKLADAAVAAMTKTGGTRDLAVFFDTRARIQNRLGNRPQAIADFQSALRFNPNYIDALVSQADLLLQLNRRDAALPLLDRADTLLRLDPNAISPPVLRQLNRLRQSLRPPTAETSGAESVAP